MAPMAAMTVLKVPEVAATRGRVSRLVILTERNKNTEVKIGEEERQLTLDKD